MLVTPMAFKIVANRPHAGLSLASLSCSRQELLFPLRRGSAAEQYAETPQYLRKKLFPMHPTLRLAGLLNPLDAPHHMRVDDDCSYREGVVTDRPIKKGAGSFVDIGKRLVRAIEDTWCISGTVMPL